MKNKSSSLIIRVPHELKEKIEFAAKEQGISMNQFAMYIFTKEVTRLEIEKHESKEWQNILNKYVKGKSKEELKKDFMEVMNKVKNNSNIPETELI